MHGWERAIIIFAWAREGQIRPRLEISEQSQVRLGPFIEGAWPGGTRSHISKARVLAEIYP